MDQARVGLLLKPGFSLAALAGVHDALHHANELQDECRYEPILLGQGPVEAAGGAAVQTQLLDPGAEWFALFVIAPGPDCAELALVRAWAERGVVLAGIEGGAAVLAAAGLLDGQRACASWPLLDGLAHQHPQVAWSQGLWEMNGDGTRLSCAGASASLDLLAAWLALRHGERLLVDLALALGQRGFRARDERQRPEPQSANPKLAEALTLMEANLGEPLPTEEIARLVGVSRRQLERLFKQHLGSLPLRHYLELRLARARRLLQQSSQSILQVGLSCGFSSGSHFSNAYKAQYGHTPRDERRQRGSELSS